LVIEATICHIFDGRRLLLKKATRGISVGKWNAPGGKIEPGESPEENAKREVREETGLRIRDLFYHGSISFFMDGGEELDIKVRLFSTRKFQGRLDSTDEGEVRWFEVTKIPLTNMWDDDRYWLHLMLAGGRFNAKFYYDRSNRRVTKYEIRSWGNDLRDL
jgi:8-oxo-dGTP diphosphatase